MNPHPEIDETLARLGSVEPPAGLARRIELRLAAAPEKPWLTLPRALAACALAASVAASALFLDPQLRHVLPLRGNNHTVQQGAPPRVAPPEAGFGAARTMVVPATPVPVQPSPVSHGRGHARSGRVELPAGSPVPLPRGVAAPPAVPAQSVSR